MKTIFFAEQILDDVWFAVRVVQRDTEKFPFQVEYTFCDGMEPNDLELTGEDFITKGNEWSEDVLQFKDRTRALNHADKTVKSLRGTSPQDLRIGKVTYRYIAAHKNRPPFPGCGHAGLYFKHDDRFEMYGRECLEWGEVVFLSNSHAKKVNAAFGTKFEGDGEE